MPIEWAGLGPELLLRLDRERRTPLHRQLEQQLREAIRSGRLEAGERLPSSRVLARELGVSRGLVLECYAQLQGEGYVNARGGSATRVAAGAQGIPIPARRAVRSPMPAIDFRYGVSDLTTFPRDGWARALGDACRGVSASEVGYADQRGSEALREVLAGYLRRVRRAVADPERIVICSGATQGVNLVIRALARQGVEWVAFEDPGNPRFRTSVPLTGVEPIAIGVDEGGIDVGALAASGARAALLTPAHQCPTGGLLLPERRQALVGWASEQRATVIEDDYDSEFRYDREPVGALQGLAPQHVAMVGSVSKTLAPGLRLGWVLCPPKLADAIVEEQEREDRGFPIIDQLALAALITSGSYDRHLRRMRTIYAARRNALVEALAHHAPGVELRGIAAGLHAVIGLPEGAREDEVVAAARERSVGVYPMSYYRSRTGRWPPALVLGFGNLGEAAIGRGIAVIADLLRRS